MAQTVEEALAQAAFYSDGQDYQMVKLSPRAITAAAGVIAEAGEAFAALIVDKDEVTLILKPADISDFGNRLRDAVISGDTYRLITLDVELEPTLVGFMARVSAALAGAGITLMPFAAFSRDHLLVPASRFDEALRVLEQLKASVKGSA